MESKKFISGAFVRVFKGKVSLSSCWKGIFSALLSAILLSFVKFKVLDRQQSPQFIKRHGV